MVTKLMNKKRILYGGNRNAGQKGWKKLKYVWKNLQTEIIGESDETVHGMQEEKYALS